jgi:hypothetical protein
MNDHALPSMTLPSIALRLSAAAFALVALTAASAAPRGHAASPLEPAFGAAIVSTHPDGRKARLWLQRNGAYAAQGRAGERSSGVWKLKGAKLCLTQRKPVPIPIHYCKAFPHVKLGQRWPDVAVNGDKVVNELVPGRR